MDYLAWNNEIGRHFFNPDRNGTRVFLYVTEDIINDIGAPREGNLEDFLLAIRKGPPWITRHHQSICQHALQALKNWRDQDLNYPPYLAYLALFVLADTINTPGFARHAYYPGLRICLGEEPQIGMYPSFQYMYRLWDDLAVWSNQDKEGEWGYFHADIVGEWMHVGLPRSQTVLTERERGGLPFLFEENGFDPYSPPSDVELAYLLASESQHRLRPHTKELLRSREPSDQPLREALIDVILDELQNWDGSVPIEEEASQEKRSYSGNLRLVMFLDRTAGHIKFHLRCRSNLIYPEEGLRFSCTELAKPLFCFDDWHGWSTLLSTDESQKEPFDATLLDWETGATFKDVEYLWRANLNKRPVKVFVSGDQYGFSGYVEENQIPQTKSFYLLVPRKYSNLVEEWGRLGCEGFEPVDVTSGLPDPWQLYFIRQVNSDELISNAFPSLAFPRTILIQFIGGLKVRGYQYMSFALPKVKLSGNKDLIQLYCNDVPMLYDQHIDLYSIPYESSANRLIIEARHNSDCVKKRSIYVSDTLDWKAVQPIFRFDRFGCRSHSEESGSCFGPFIEGFIAPDVNLEILLPPTRGHRVYFIGRNPGEIVACPNEPLPTEWEPIWAIPMRRKGYAIFCGTSLEGADPVKVAKGDIRHIKLWKEILWFKRKRIAVPSHSKLVKLWNEYVEVAHYVC